MRTKEFPEARERETSGQPVHMKFLQSCPPGYWLRIDSEDLIFLAFRRYSLGVRGSHPLLVLSAHLQLVQKSSGAKAQPERRRVCSCLLWHALPWQPPAYSC